MINQTLALLLYSIDYKGCRRINIYCDEYSKYKPEVSYQRMNVGIFENSITIHLNDSHIQLTFKI